MSAPTVPVAIQPVTSAAPLSMTAAEFTARYASADVTAELIAGVVKELPMTWPKHGKLCLTIGHLICSWNDSHDAGHVMSNDAWVRTTTNPDSVRGGDICFFTYDRLPKGEVPEGLLPTVPDLVVEVRSPSDRWTELFAKVIEYIHAGVRAVVVLDPASKTASVYRDDQQIVFRVEDSLTVPDILPGFAVQVGRLFE